MIKPFVKINKGIGIFSLLAFVAIGFNLISAKLQTPETTKFQIKNIKIVDSLAKSDEFNRSDNALAIFNDIPFRNSLYLIRQVAFSISRCASVDFKFVGFDKDKNNACNFKTYFDLSHIDFFDTVSSIVFKSLKIPFCPIRARVSHGPPFERLS